MKQPSKDTVKRYDFVKKPKKPNFLFKTVIKIASSVCLKGIDLKIQKNGMDGLKPPYIVLASHMSFFDFSVMAKATRPYAANNVCALDGINQYSEFLLRNAGVIGKRKFIKDMSLLRNMKYCVDKLKNVLIMYPEAKYSLDGTTSFLPFALGKLTKFLGVPVVTAVLNGDYVAQPQWNNLTKKRSKLTKKKVPLRCTLSLTATAEDVKNLDESELQKRIEAALAYDEFKWQKDNNIVIDHAERARGLNKLLYQCAACGTEHRMDSDGAELFCAACGKRWQMTQYGGLRAVYGETEFEHIPDWFEWQRKNVLKQILDGTYYFEDTVRVETLPAAKGFYGHGTGKLVHSLDGFTLTCNAYGEPVTEHWDGVSVNGVHIEYNYKRGITGVAADVLDISTNDESYWLYPLNKKDIVTKISLATDEIYKIKLAEARQKENTKNDQ